MKMHKFANMDDATAGYFSRQLEFIKSKVWEVMYQELLARKLFSVSNEGGLGAETVVFRVFDQVGMAKIIGANARDLPRVDVNYTEILSPVRTAGDAFGYTLQEIAASQMAGRNLRDDKAKAARRAFEELVNSIAFFGDAANGLLGFLNNPNIPVGNVAGGVWSTKTPEEILFDINSMFAEIFEDSKQRHRPTKLLLPTGQWSYIMSTQLTGRDKTIAQFIVDTSPYIKSMDDIEAVPELVGAGVGATDRMAAYDPNPEYIELLIPYEQEFLAPQEKGLEIEINTHGRIGGVQVLYPLSVSFKDGI